MSLQIPNIGEKWILKNDHAKVCTVLAVEIEDAGALRGYVSIRAPWMKRSRFAGKSLDTFLKQYERKA